MNNKSIRTAMIRAGIKQAELAEILGCSQSSVSVMLSRELSRSEQKKVVALINSREVLNHEKDKNDTSSV